MALTYMLAFEVPDPRAGVGRLEYGYDDADGSIDHVQYQNETTADLYFAIVDLADPLGGPIRPDCEWTLPAGTKPRQRSWVPLRLSMAWYTSPKTGLSGWALPYGFVVRWPAS